MSGLKYLSFLLAPVITVGSACQRFDLSISDNSMMYPGSDNQIIIKRKPNFSSTDHKVKVESVNQVKAINSLGVEVVKTPENKSMDQYLKELESDPTVEYAEPNYVRKITLYQGDLAVNNSKVDLKNYIRSNSLSFNKNANTVNIFRSIFNDPDISLQYGLEAVHATKAWELTSGNAQVVVAVVDTGVDLKHPDLEDNLVNGYTSIKGTTSANDDNGHGTHVSGIVAAISNNSRGGVGLAPKCKIMPVKALSGKGEGNDSDIAEGIIWAVDHGANVINLSLGGVGAGKTLENAMKYAYNSDVIVIAAMGNNGQNVKNYPASYKNVIAVGATDANNRVTPFSNYGSWISVAAPGLKIQSTFPTYKVELSRYNLPTSYASMSGTSMAVPFVAALSGLILSQNLGAKRSEVRRRIEQSCSDFDRNGFDEFSGFGIIDAQRALTLR